MFTLRAELSISRAGNAPREIRFSWMTEDDDKRDVEAAEIERLREEGKEVIRGRHHGDRNAQIPVVPPRGAEPVTSILSSPSRLAL
jgi:hypothetical protein